MDEEYIKMCFWNEEIQELWKPKVGDKTIWKPGLTPHMINDDDFQGGYDSRGHPDEPKYHVWLPRQEDLQEICRKNHVCMLPWGLKDFWEKQSVITCLQMSGAYLEEFYSRVWLMVVMETVYGKRWIDGTWKKID